MGRFVYDTKYSYPDYKLKLEFYVGTFSEDDWKLGESACVDQCYYRLPNDSEYAIFKFAERTRTGGKRLRWEVYHNGRFSNNYFTCFDDAVEEVNNEIRFNGFDKDMSKYRIRSRWEG